MSESSTSTGAPTLPASAESGKALTPAPAAVVAATPSAEILPPRRKKRVLLPMILLAAALGGGYEGYRWFVEGRFLVSTDDAYVKADTSVIAAKVGGYIASVAVVQNAAVSKGDVLAVIDDGDYRNAVDAAEAKIATQDATVARIGRQMEAQAAGIDQAKASLLSVKAEALRTGTEYDRAHTLMQSTYGTQQRLDQALADRDRAAAAVVNAQAAVTAAEASLDVLKAQQVEARQIRGELQTSLAMAQRNLDFTVIRAPFDGVVGNKAVQPGQYVQTGTRLLALVPMRSAYIEANFKETQIDRLHPGQRVTVKPDAFSTRAIEGTVESIAPASGAEFSLLPPENATGNFTKVVQRVPVRIGVPAEVADEGSLRPGLSVEVEVHTRDESLPAPTLTGSLGLDAIAARLPQIARR